MRPQSASANSELLLRASRYVALWVAALIFGVLADNSASGSQPVGGLTAESPTAAYDSALIRSALAAGGCVDPVECARHVQRVARLARQLEAEMPASAEPRAAALHLRRFLHQQIFTAGYDADASHLAGTLDSGRYNCLSATLLFVALAPSAGLQAEGCETPGHIAPVIRTAAGEFLLEMTNLRSRPTPAPVAEPSARRLAAAALVSCCYYNVCVAALADARYAAAERAGRRAVELDPDHRQARDNWLISLNNWSVTLALAGRPHDARALVRRGLRLAPDFAPLVANEAWLDEREQNRPADLAGSDLTGPGL